MFRILRGLLMHAGLLTIVGCSPSTTVKMTYTSQPRAELTRGGSSAVRVAVKPISAHWSSQEAGGNLLLPSGPISWTWTYHDSSGAHQTGTYTLSASSPLYETADAKVWGEKLRSAVIDLLRKHGGRRVKIVERERMDLYWDEMDRKLASSVKSHGNPEATQWDDVDLFVVGNIEGRSTLRQEYKNPTKPLGFVAGFAPVVGGALEYELSRPKPYYQRTITLAGNLRLVDAATGRTWDTHEISAQTLEEEKSYPFKDASRLSMPPEEGIIRDILDQEVRKFCAAIVPITFEHDWKVKSSANENSQLGVKYLRAGDDAAALAAFERALADNPDDDRSCFGAGVACERLGRLHDARRYYRDALMACDKRSIDAKDHEHQYEQALRSVEHRIRNGGRVMAGSM
ncbi:MAG: hypothetical protein D6744_04025 [Planctomycetota bacterium]|nr:MAG: hypothetical protein D6744_04025 [Planctomycetota bacterium]